MKKKSMMHGEWYNNNEQKKTMAPAFAKATAGREALKLRK